LTRRLPSNLALYPIKYNRFPVIGSAWWSIQPTDPGR